MLVARLSAVFVLLLLAGIPVQAETAPSSPAEASAQESSSRAQPDAPPSPPDAPMPDLDKQTSPQPKSKAKKIGNKLDPHCIDVIFHTCWSSPAESQGKVLTEEEQRAQTAAKDIEVGYYYLNDKSYVAAESRLREAAELQPDSAAAWVGLAQAQQKLHKDDAARKSYEAYLKLNPDSAGAEKARKALASLQAEAH